MSIDIVVVFGVENSNKAELAKHFSALAAHTLTEPGCERFEVYEQKTEADGFVLVERWKNEASIADHMGMPYTEHFLAVAKPLIARSEVHRLSALVIG
ncbi:antibiotic biosynthesis monooxygenase [Pseudomonas sp. MAFF 212408]|uniref:Antibiotic biosynthesis monooxygenase n=1 Tax=Pseudomonas kitaguniensis TaxID=2607908 RepID=A0A5N7KGW9_9PSED|nr:putative quinol monooxygenase [Pseudomonas kitaguniensis]MPR01454.1 antibiotic biosynthesis monooxygenase [Pseudomonas kitaguniensis]